MRQITSKTQTWAFALLLMLTSFAPLSAAVCQHDVTDQQPQPGKEQPERRPPFNPQEFRKKVEGYITREARLTPQEAKAFFPLYHQMKEQQRNLQAKINRAIQRVEREKLSEADCKRIISLVQKLQEQFNGLEKCYHSKFAKVLPAEKILRVMNAERNFGREMFRKGPKK